MSKPFYIYSGGARLPYMIAINPTPVNNCDCDAPKKRLKYHRKTCASYNNQVQYYRLSPIQRLKSMFLPAEKIFNFYQDEL